MERKLVFCSQELMSIVIKLSAISEKEEEALQINKISKVKIIAVDADNSSTVAKAEQNHTYSESIMSVFCHPTSEFIRVSRCSRKTMVASKHKGLYWFRLEPYV